MPFDPFFKQKMPTEHSVSPVVVKVGGRTTVIEMVFVIDVFAFEVACTVTVAEAATVGATKVAEKSASLVRQGFVVPD
jgi:Zn finger protein HypA/HybF involved in hydrogenase expression